MIRGIQREIGSSLLFVTHDMGVHAALTDRLGIMYAGRLVEEAPHARDLRAAAPSLHRHLIGSLPRIGDAAPRKGLEGSPPNLADPPPGCRFHPRCPLAMDVCRREQPAMIADGPDHRVACYAVNPHSEGHRVTGAAARTRSGLARPSRAAGFSRTAASRRSTTSASASRRTEPEIFTIIGESGSGKSTSPA